jgi:glycolate oxidase iron-sulfur subunit
MQHKIDIDKLGPQGEEMARAVESCVHCGFCLPTCPTYVTLGEEMNSPRGRIVLMKSALEGDIELEDTLPYVDRCLGCMACVTACPSGVQYGELLNPFRALSDKKRTRSASSTLTRRVVRETLLHPSRFKKAASVGALIAPLGRFLPSSFTAMLELLPEELPPAAEPLPTVHSAEGKRRMRVALVAGCVQQVLAPQINWATLRVLAKNGVEVVVPENQGCCGSLMTHTGEDDIARSLARQLMSVMPTDVDAVITNAAGCGSGMKEYGLLFKGMPEEDHARALAAKVRDATELLVELDIDPPALPQAVKLAYHDACHLAHAQRIVDAPRQLLRAISNITLLEIPEAELCCGSAGTYNVEQPALAGAIGERKANHIIATDAEAVAAGNIGCLVQIRTHLARLGRPIPILHTIEVLDRAYRGDAITMRSERD